LNKGPNGQRHTFLKRHTSKCYQPGPADRSSLSTDAAWLKRPATEKQFDLFYKVNGYGESGRPEDMIVNDKLIAVRDVTKGQKSGFM